MLQNKILLLGEAWGEGEEQWHHEFVRFTGAELAKMLGDAEICPGLMIHCKSCGKHTSFQRCDNCGFYNKATEPQMIEFWNETRNNHQIFTGNVFNQRPENFCPKCQQWTVDIRHKTCGTKTNSNDELFFFGTKSDDISPDFPPYSIGTRKYYLLNKYTYHLERLSQAIQLIRPNIIVALGNIPSWSLLGITQISRIRGTVQWSKKHNVKVLPTFHPSYVLHNISDRPIVIADLKKAGYESGFPEIRRPERWIYINPTFSEMEEFFNHDMEFEAVDIESGFSLYSKTEINQIRKWEKKSGRRLLSNLASQISMVGFARDESHALVIPLMSRDGNNLSIYDNPHDEIRAAEFIQYGLSLSCPKVFQNGLYDINRLLHFGFRPKNCLHDTMIRMHADLAEMRKSLEFLASIFLNDIPWKTMYGSESLKRDE